MQAERARWEAMLDAANAGLEEDAARAAAAAEAGAAREADLAARLAAAEAEPDRAAAAEARAAAAEAAAEERGAEAGALRARLAGLEAELADDRARAGPGPGPGPDAEGRPAEGEGLGARLAAAEAELAELREDHNALLACLGQETAKARAAAVRRLLGCMTPRGLARVHSGGVRRGAAPCGGSLFCEQTRQAAGHQRPLSHRPAAPRPAGESSGTPPRARS